MLFHRIGLGFAPSSSNPERRHCYVRSVALDQLLETPGALDLLAEELDVASAPAALSLVEQLDSIRRRAIHLAVTHSPVCGLSVEEIAVVTAYTSRRFDHLAWKRELLHQPSEHDLNLACKAWLLERSTVICSGHQLGHPDWSMVGGVASDQATPAPFTIAVAPIHDPDTLDLRLEHLGSDANFAHEHYLACSPATALGYLYRHAHRTRPARWDPLVLDRRLRTLGLGLLLVEREGVLLYLPARYEARARSKP
jgi:hypothetical protein